ncbi:hypothetical protein BDR26DRAFT_891903 [Obelidium mucronatum]|nr:hypothetical protein BDR26DRAFT_891903 [Obelidium mucronatum]
MSTDDTNLSQPLLSQPPPQQFHQHNDTPHFSPQQLDSHQQRLFSNYFLLGPNSHSEQTPPNHSNESSLHLDVAHELAGMSRHSQQQQPPFQRSQHFGEVVPFQLQQDASLAHQSQQQQEEFYSGGSGDAGGGTATSNNSKNSKELQIGSDEWMKAKKESHKEVERRRRDVISAGIDILANMVPSTEKKKGKAVNAAVQYIRHLKETERENAEKWAVERMLAEQAIRDLTGTVKHLAEENRLLLENLVLLRASGAPKREVDQQNAGPPQQQPSDSKKRKM